MSTSASATTSTSVRAAPAIAWGVAILGVALVALGLVLWAGRGFGLLPVSFGRSITGVVGLVVAPLTYITFGALLSARIPRNAVGWLLLGSGLLLAAMLPVNLLVAMSHESLRQPDSTLIAVAWLRNAFATPGVAVLLIVAVYLFPDGRPISRRWAAGIAVGILGGSLLVLGAVLKHEGMLSYPTLSNPTAVTADLVPLVNAIQVMGVTLTLIAAVHAIASVANRYRAGDDMRRAQLRWILLATMITAFAAIPFLLTRYLIDVGNSLGELSALGVQLAMCAFPIAAAAAISRYRLYEVDLLIGRTLVYVPLMAILGGLYTAAIAIFQRLFVALTGQTSDVAVVLTVLLVASLFTPLRRSLEAALERRFPTHSTQRPGLEPSASLPAVPGGARVSQSVPVAQLRSIDAQDRVDCPIVGAPVHLSKCLACAELRAITNGPNAAVVCTGTAPPAQAAQAAS